MESNRLGDEAVEKTQDVLRQSMVFAESLIAARLAVRLQIHRAGRHYFLYPTEESIHESAAGHAVGELPNRPGYEMIDVSTPEHRFWPANDRGNQVLHATHSQRQAKGGSEEIQTIFKVYKEADGALRLTSRIRDLTETNREREDHLPMLDFDSADQGFDSAEQAADSVLRFMQRAIMDAAAAAAEQRLGLDATDLGMAEDFMLMLYEAEPLPDL
jgi:hypothetical protein